MRGNGAEVVSAGDRERDVPEVKSWTHWHCDSCLFSFPLVTVAVLKAAVMGSPRVEAMASSLAMVDSSKAMDSSKAITPLRATDSRTSTTVAVEVVEGVAEVRGFLLLCLMPAFRKKLYSLRPLP